MRITRRNTLVVLLVLVAAGGIVGTGAFSQVSADRSVSVTTAGDSSANVQFGVNTADHPSLSDGDSDGTINFDFDNVNLDATTTYDDALNISLNSGQSDSYTVSVGSTPADVEVDFDGSSSTTAGAGETVQADVTLNTTGTTQTSNANLGGDIEFTVTSNDG